MSSSKNYPKILQLYPRNSQNEANFYIEGETFDHSISDISVITYRNDSVYHYQNQYFQVNNPISAFVFLITIKAELAEYDIAIYKHQSKSDSSLVVNRKSIVAGDTYLITGQSNAFHGILDENNEVKKGLYTSKYARSFGVFNLPDNRGDYNPADTLWNYSNQGNIGGLWGTELQKLIIEKYQIPVCIINGGTNGSSSEYNSLRDSLNPQALNTAYGRLLYRVKKAGLDKNIKGFFYRQGENEADGATLAWKPNFEKLYQNLKKDLPSINKFYLFQNNIYTFPNNLSGQLREHQRIMQEKYSDITSIATIGAEGFDGIHYSQNGHLQTGAEVFRIVENDFYSKTYDENIYSPNIQSAYFRNGRTELVLQFEQGQEMFFNTLGQKFEESIRKFFILNDGAVPISVSAINNKVCIKLDRESWATSVSYMPAYIKSGELGFPNYDNLIYNRLKMRPLTFENFPISTQTGKPEITATKVGKNVLINCSRVNEAKIYRIQYRHGADSEFENIIMLNENQLTNFLFRFESFVDNFEYDVSIDIRMFAINSDGTESDFSNIVHIDFYLKPPKIVAAKTISDSEIELELDQPIDPNLKYIVEYNSGKFSGDVKIESGNKFIISNLRGGTKYSFKVRVENLDETLFSKFSEPFVGYTLLAAPIGLVASQITPNETTLQWTYNDIFFVLFGSIFEIELSKDGVNFDNILKHNTNEFSANLKNLTEGTTYYIRLVAKSGDDIYSKYSEIIKINTLPVGPSNASIKSIKIDKIILTWKDNSNGEKAYQIFQKIGDSFEKIAEIEANSTEYIVSQLLPSTKYFFKIAAKGADGISEFSDTVSAETLTITNNEAEIFAEQFHIFPNPIEKLLFLESTQPSFKKYRVGIISQDGKSCLEQWVKQPKMTLNLENFPKGFYTLIIHKNGSTLHKKLLKN